MQKWVKMGYKWVFKLKISTQWVGFGFKLITHNPRAGWVRVEDYNPFAGYGAVYTTVPPFINRSLRSM
jgi:hypothetical protein